MGLISIFQSVTVDGVMQGLGRPDEDTRGGFTHGGWGDGFRDEVSMQYAGEGMSRGGALLFGHRSYDDVLGAWTGRGTDNPFTDVLVNRAKYVVSRSAQPDAPPYPNTEFVVGDAVATVAALKERIDDDLMILGSGELVRALHGAELIDRYSLLIHPIVLGSGTKLFGDGDRVDLQLERTIPTTTGVIIAEYLVRR